MTQKDSVSRIWQEAVDTRLPRPWINVDQQRKLGQLSFMDKIVPVEVRVGNLVLRDPNEPEKGWKRAEDSPEPTCGPGWPE